MIELDVEEQKGIDQAKGKEIGYVMSLAEMAEKQILACDILCMLEYPITGGNLVSILDNNFHSPQRIIFFIPGREAKYVKVSE